MIKKISGVLTGFILLSYGCYNDKEELLYGPACDGVTPSFVANVNPIIQSTCATDATCHGAGSANGPGPLLTYTQISGASVNIKTAVASGTMPKTGSLTTAQKNSIICWINSGSPNN